MRDAVKRDAILTTGSRLHICSSEDESEQRRASSVWQVCKSLLLPIRLHTTIFNSKDTSTPAGISKSDETPPFANGANFLTPEICSPGNSEDVFAFEQQHSRQDSSGDKNKFGPISKMGNGYMRRLLVVGVTSGIRRADPNPSATGAWVRLLLVRNLKRLTTVALAARQRGSPRQL